MTLFVGYCSLWYIDREKAYVILNPGTKMLPSIAGPMHATCTHKMRLLNSPHNPHLIENNHGIVCFPIFVYPFTKESKGGNGACF